MEREELEYELDQLHLQIEELGEPTSAAQFKRLADLQASVLVVQQQLECVE